MAGSALHRLLRSAISGLEGDFDQIREVVTDRQESHPKVRLLSYAGYRNDRLARIKGRIVRYAPPLDAQEGLWRRFRAMLDIYHSHELPGIEVRLEGYGQSLCASTDEEGYFDFEVPTGLPLPEATTWEQVTLSAPGREAQKPRIEVPVMAPGADQHWGIISDIDDTVIETGATNFIKNWRRVLIERPQDRLAVPGASTLYKMIARDHVAPARAFFYVSSSPWNLYGFIAEFMQLNGIPHGPMFLQDYGIAADRLVSAHHDDHKLAAIRNILSFYPEFRFLLIGDNGQRDVTIYAKAVAEFGPRVAGVFIRDVDGSCRSGEEGDMLRRIEADGVPTYCGAGFDDAVNLVKSLNLDRPLEAARAMTEPAGQE
ncbi:MAG TPA: phosphatase domain-containing protein [Allosphingosinicella sp.]|nr:phosphatase domain-containing protein [Allosphingosinicella sp.]